ncbi:MAG: septum formation inhibitor Maf [Gammaproteobacteria bacterium]|nr:septum formation inhibitor Maf [Gammaproteobacteria bacterium]
MGVSSLLLASASPRRQQLLQQLGISFDICAPDIDECHRANESLIDYAQRMAVEKVMTIHAEFQKQQPLNTMVKNPLILGADTCGEIDGTLLSKPIDFADAQKLLSMLSDSTHQIYSAFALYDGARLHTEVITSKVTMRAITDDEILAYWNTGEPVDKAGAYAIQGQGAQFISHLSGSYSAVMGLPLFELSQALATYDFRIL